MIRILIAGAGTVVFWIIGEVLGEAILEALRILLRPISRPLSRIARNARSPWPLILAITTAVVVGMLGLLLISVDSWIGWAGVAIFIGGFSASFVAPLWWRDVRATPNVKDASRPVI